jgi:hypothetical protein
VGCVQAERESNLAALCRQLLESAAFRRTKNLRTLQMLLASTKPESTVRYLGIEVDDALEMAEQTEA